MASPAQRHFQRVSAAKEAAANEGSQMRPNSNQFELMMAQLYEHKMQLKNIESVKLKGEKKAALLPDYAHYVEGVLEADAGHADDVLTTVLLWRIDAKDFAGALDIAAYVIKHNLSMPDSFKRSACCLIVEEMADAAKSGDVPLSMLQSTLEITRDGDMPDQVRAKLHKWLGLNEELQTAEPATALNHLQTALSFDDKAGVKKPIEKLARVIKKAEEAAKAEETAEAAEAAKKLTELAADTPAPADEPQA